MRYRIDKNASADALPRRFLGPAAVEFANLYAAIGETFKHFDAQICAAERELEILRGLHGIPVVANRAATGRSLGDNGY